MLFVFPYPIPIFDVLVRCASLSIVPHGSVPISLPLQANIESESDMDVVKSLPVALADKAFVVDAFETDVFVTDASLVEDIAVPWRSKINNFALFVVDRDGKFKA